ncbi:hypothetical protein [Halomicronema sp. CCY15110]|uniref:hypothetical protein n=1 Tax=Halomicronema sp. CCY15110 TaxID=2767773 RepID=UPI001950FA6F|nr:hypothetical protein [Halomicronema sp. CCY15110]
MQTTTTRAPRLTAHQRRLRAITKRLVIELGYLEHCLAEGLQDTNVQTAAASLYTAIDCLNDHLQS